MNEAELIKERKKLDAYAESIYTGLRLFTEIAKRIESFTKNGNNGVVECSECGQLTSKD